MPDTQGLNYWGGLIQGFQGRREQEYAQNYKKDLQNRQLADRVFQHLLASRDTQMQDLAMRGLMAPTGQRKGGLAGFLGGTEDAVSPLIQQIIARSNEMIPDTSQAPPVSHAPQPGPGSAAMPTSTMVEGGAGPMAMPPPPPTGPFNPGGEMDLSGAEAPPELGGMGGMSGGMGMPPPTIPNPMKRRGTGVADAFEIEAYQQHLRQQAPIDAINANLAGDDARRAKLGHWGTPEGQKNFAQVNQWGVRLASEGPIIPVSFDATTGRYALPDGTPVPASFPPGAGMVRMTGGGAASGALTSTAEDSPELRQQLIALGADPAVIARGTSTKYWRIRQGQDGSVLVQPAEYAPPPALGGTFETGDPNLPGVPVRRGINRVTGGAGAVLGDVDNPQESDTATRAKALLEAVDAEVTLRGKSLSGRVSGVSPQQRDQITAQKAQALGLPYLRYDDAVMVAKATPKVTPRQKATGGTMAERVRARAQAIKAGAQGGGAATPPPPGP